MDGQSSINIARLAELARRQMALQTEIEQLEAQVKTRKKDLAVISEGELPAALAEVGLSDYTTTEGLKVRIEGGLSVSVAGKYHDPIVAWLREEGHDDIIKHTVVALFDKGQDALATALAGELSDRGLVTSEKEDVNAMTFKALVRELMDDGQMEPDILERLGVGQWRRAKVTPPATKE